MRKIVIAFASILVLGSQTVFAQLPNGEKSLIHTQTATTYNKGQLGIYSNMNFYSKVGDFLGNVKPANFQSVNYWLVASNLDFTYGIWRHIDATLGIRLYQDTHHSNDYNLPDDIFLTVRAGGFKFGRNRFAQAFMTSFRIPTGEVHNYPFTEYTTNSFEWALMYAFSYYKDPYLPYRSFSAHFNIGWWNYNELGTELYKFENGTVLKATKNSSDLRMALGLIFPTQLFDFRLEMTGMVFLQKPDSYVYSAEEWSYITPSVRYKPMDWFAFDLGVDFRISPKDRNNTSGIPQPSASLDLPPNFPDWRVQMGLNFKFNLGAANKTSDLSYEEQEAQKKIEQMEMIVNEQERAKSVQDQIDNLKDVSKEAEDEIEELKKILGED